MGILGTEGGAEGVHIAVGAGEDLGLQLPAHRQESRLAEEILGVVHQPVRLQGWSPVIQGGDPEHLARTLAVAGGDDRGVDINKAPLLKEAVDRVGQAGAHAEDGPEEIGTRPQVGDLTQKLRRVALLLERVGVVRPAQQADFPGLHLPGLALALRRHEGADHLQGGSGGETVDTLESGAGLGHDHLEVLQAGAIVDLNERKALGVAAGADPALDKDAFEGGGAAQGRADTGAGNHEPEIAAGAAFSSGLW